MKLWIKFILGFLAHSFLLSMGFFLFFLVPKIIQITQGPAKDLPPEFLVYIPIALSGGVLSLITTGIFIAYIVKNPKFTSTERLVWILLLAFASALAVPLFFWAVILRHPSGMPFFSPKASAAHA